VYFKLKISKKMATSKHNIDTWSALQCALDGLGKDKKWLADRLGIEKIQSVDHWKNRGIPHKYRSAIDNLFDGNNDQLTIVENTCINGDMRLNQCVDYLLLRLADIHPDDSDAIAAILAALARNPHNVNMRAALIAALSPMPIESSDQKAA